MDRRTVRRCVSLRESSEVAGWSRRRARRLGPPPIGPAKRSSTRSGSAGLIDGALVADLFAGTGAVGIEALSRGAAHCTFVERDRSALRALEENIDTLGLEERTRVLRSDAGQAAATLDVDIVFIDPPYDFDGWAELLAVVRGTVRRRRVGSCDRPDRRMGRHAFEALRAGVGQLPGARGAVAFDPHEC